MRMLIATVGPLYKDVYKDGKPLCGEKMFYLH